MIIVILFNCAGTATLLLMAAKLIFLGPLVGVLFFMIVLVTFQRINGKALSYTQSRVETTHAAQTTSCTHHA